ncbi:MAM domain-containing glycosylphosphatidylinositol anchor protein 1-like isoform X2 [Odontesthes bonariensis]|uniref:MAM domain-containing glycosylphosphatidylinositol anchor protein 1-like isoform X2 n=1 Tax=Odontesthes bonariensis TaxID=219752 RepID=UPI003F583F0C
MLHQFKISLFISTGEDHNAKFRCEAHMDLGPEGPQLHASSQELSVDVTFGPYIECSVIALREEETLNGKCTVTGFPTPDVKWLKDGQSINPNAPLRRNDSGTYTLKAKGFSSAEKDIQVHVLYGPEKICEDTYTLSEYTAHNFKCTQGFPPPQEIWYRDDEEVDLPENITRRDKGLYWVNASNTHSSVNFTVEIIVLYPPTQIEDLEDAKVNVGDDFRLTCSSKSNPRPNYFWSYHQMANVKEETEDGVSRLIIHKATGYNSGSYTCRVSNEGATVFKTVRVTVEDISPLKPPDHVSINVVNNLSSVEEGRELQLQCDIINVAPAQNLTVRWTWYRGNDTIKPVELNNRSCDSHSVTSPVNVSCTMNVTLNRTHNGLEIRCEALLDLGSDGPQPPPNTMSQPLKINVIYKPEINTTKLPGTIPVFRGYPEELVCKADGNPPPNITWVYNSDTAKLNSDGDLVVFDAGIYECRAENFLSTTHSVQVILKEDYLPLIAGFVAVAVVAISVIFLFIFSIYYKNTKMRRYSLKNAKLSTHNSNVAHNGWDMQFPITKLS